MDSGVYSHIIELSPRKATRAKTTEAAVKSHEGSTNCPGKERRLKKLLNIGKNWSFQHSDLAILMTTFKYMILPLTFFTFHILIIPMV